MTKTEFKNKLTSIEWDTWCGVAFITQDNAKAMFAYWLDSQSIDDVSYTGMCDILEANGVIDATRKATLMGDCPSPSASQLVGVGVNT